MFSLLFVAFLAALLLVDLIFLPRASRRVWKILFAGFLLAGLAALYPEPLFRLSEALGLGRPVDAVIYVSTVILVRELFLTRGRVARLEDTITRLTRNIAVSTANEVHLARDEA